MHALPVESSRRRVPTIGACALLVLSAASTPLSGQTRDAFGDALLRTAAVLAGQGGGTPARVDAALADLANSLVRWDESIRALEVRSRSELASATPHEAAQIRTTLGVALFERGRLPEALVEFTEASRQYPTLDAAWTMRAMTLEALGDPAAARRSLEAGLVATPDAASLAYHLNRLAPAPDDPQTLLPEATTLLRVAGQRRDTPQDTPMAFVDLSIVDDRSTARYRFLPAGYGVVVVPLLTSRRYDEMVAALRDLAARDRLRADPALSSDAFAAAALDIENGKAESAVARLAAVESALSQSSEFHRLRGAARRQLAGPADAIPDLETAVRLAPWNERAVIALLNVLLEVPDVARAARLATEAETTLHDSAALAWIQTQIAGAMGRDSEVAAALERSLRAQPLAGAGAMWSMLGVIRMRSFDPQATAALQQDVRLNPNRPEAHQLLGESLRADGRINEAFGEFSAVALLERDSVRAHLNIGEMHLDAGRYPEAVASLRWVVARQPRLARARHALASALLRTGRAQEAQAELDVFARLQDEAVTAARDMRRLGVLYVEAGFLADSGDCVAAIEVRSKLIELEPAVANHHVELAACLIRLGKYDRAALALERATALGAAPVTYRWLADVYATLGRQQESAEAARQYERRQQEVRRTQGLVR